MNRTRYDDDLAAWAEEQSAMLRAGELASLDLENIAEEIESLGRSQRREARSRLEVLTTHLLKWRFQPSRRSISWRVTIRTQRIDLGRVVDENPSLRRVLPELLATAYPDGVDKAQQETGILELPTECPFTLDQILDLKWLPD